MVATCQALRLGRWRSQGMRPCGRRAGDLAFVVAHADGGQCLVRLCATCAAEHLVTEGERAWELPPAGELERVPPGQDYWPPSAACEGLVVSGSAQRPRLERFLDALDGVL